jgi:hypothetical protein
VCRWRFNIDQVPLPFVHGMLSTWTSRGLHRIWIRTPSEVLTKRQASAQVVAAMSSMPGMPDTIAENGTSDASPVRQVISHSPLSCPHCFSVWMITNDNDENDAPAMGAGDYFPRGAQEG